MRNLLRTLTIIGSAVVLAATVSAEQAAKAAPAKTAVTKPAAKSGSKSAIGKISRYDAGSRTLTITTAKGDQNFVLADKVVLHEGSKSITADELGSHTGRNAKVRYIDDHGRMAAEMVTVAPAKTATKASKPMKKPAGK